MRYFHSPYAHFRSISVLIFSILLILSSLLVTSSAYAREPIRTITGTVTKVSDGDTITVHTPEETKLKVRLYGIDAPETEKSNQRTGHVSKPGQPMGEDAKRYLLSKVFGKKVRLDVMDIDRYRRLVCIVWQGGKNINLEMIKIGMAEAYIEYLKDQPYRTQFIQAEKEAKASELGIWSDNAYERPCMFRKRSRISGN